MHDLIQLTHADVVRVTNTYEGTDFKNYRELAVKMAEVRARLLSQWQASLDEDGGPTNPDYSVYHDPEYNYEGIHCFEKTRQCTVNTIKYFQKLKAGNVYKGWHIGLSDPRGVWYNGKPVNELTVLDVYNGNGLTTAHLMMNSFNVETFNDCMPQIEFMQTACKDLVGRKVKNYTKLPKKKFDIVLSLEVLEHYTDPLIHVHDLVKLTAPSGYLVESSGFGSKEDNIGHFDKYVIDGKRVPHAAARKYTSDLLEFYYEKVFIGFGKMPRIWKLKDVPGVTPKPPRLEDLGEEPNDAYVKNRPGSKNGERKRLREERKANA